MANDAAKFYFWRFFFSLKGRVSRLAFAAFFLPVRLAVWGADELLRSYLTHVQPMTLGILGLALGMVDFVLLWPKFAVSVKRLHDFRLPGMIALVVFLPFAANILKTLPILGIIPLSPEFGYTASNTIFYVIWVFALILCLVPGTRGSNRYGPQPREPQTDIADTF